MATVGIPGFGYGIRYEYGMFRQTIVDGAQVETPDYWLRAGNPWEFPRPEVVYLVHFGGRTVQYDDRTEWIETEHVNAMAYDTVIPGFATTATNTLRLWSARATDEFDLSAFNQGDYRRAVEAKNTSEHVSRLLYPDDSTQAGRELRLRQEYFFVSATMQDLIRRYQRTHSHFGRLAEKVAVHLNDTHPVLAIPELMRLLVDKHHVPWDKAWKLVQQMFSYTNHTLMPEALETWDVEMLSRLLPRHLEIIFDINAQFLKQVTEKFGLDADLIRRISLVDEYGQRRVRMAHLAIVASHKVNGVSKLHSQLMTQNIFSDFARMYPERFTNVTNGITPRRWLAQASPSLSSLIDQRLGPRWRTDLFELGRLREWRDDPDFRKAFHDAKFANKLRLVERAKRETGAVIDPHALFDLQVKRIHEYKRQLLNILHVIVRYNRIREEPERDWTPRVVMFAGKAASAYKMAKNIIKLINDVAKKINADPLVGDRLKVGFIPNYGVSVAELIIPAADLSQQISMAGTEASGTGNMKLALNGALTIGTLDGANIEICDAVGRENIFIFGHTADEVDNLRATGYRPRQIYEENAELRTAHRPDPHGLLLTGRSAALLGYLPHAGRLGRSLHGQRATSTSYFDSPSAASTRAGRSSRPGHGPASSMSRGCRGSPPIAPSANMPRISGTCRCAARCRGTCRSPARSAVRLAERSPIARPGMTASMNSHCHCQPTGRANARPMTAPRSNPWRGKRQPLDRFARLSLLAMTACRTAEGAEISERAPALYRPCVSTLSLKAEAISSICC